MVVQGNFIGVVLIPLAMLKKVKIVMALQTILIHIELY